MLAVDEINAAGGVLGKQIELVGEDGASEPTVFAEKAEKLITQDWVAAVFGGWTSSSAARRCCRCSRATTRCCSTRCSTRASRRRRTSSTPARRPTSRSCPALDYLKEQGAKTLFLVGSDYVFPRTANKIIKAYAEANGIEIVGEEYAPLGYTDFSTIVNKVKTADADAVFNTLNGDSQRRLLQGVQERRA